MFLRAAESITAYVGSKLFTQAWLLLTGSVYKRYLGDLKLFLPLLYWFLISASRRRIRCKTRNEFELLLKATSCLFCTDILLRAQPIFTQLDMNWGWLTATDAFTNNILDCCNNSNLWKSHIIALQICLRVQIFFSYIAHRSGCCQSVCF